MVLLKLIIILNAIGLKQWKHTALEQCLSQKYSSNCQTYLVLLFSVTWYIWSVQKVLYSTKVMHRNWLFCAKVTRVAARCNKSASVCLLFMFVHGLFKLLLSSHFFSKIAIMKLNYIKMNYSLPCIYPLLHIIIILTWQLRN